MRKKIAAFRPEDLLPPTKELAERYGFDFFGFPVFELVEREEAFREIKNAFEEGVDMVVFTSVNGVKKSFDICEGKFDLKKKLLDADVEICAIGPVTREELEKSGLSVDLMPDEYSAVGLTAMFNAIKVKDRRIAFLRSSEGNKELIEFLDAKGAFVVDIAVYTVKKKELDEFKELFDAFVKYKPDYIIFTSSLTFKIFFELTRKLNGLGEIARDAKIVAIGNLTAETITGKGMKVDLVAEESTFEGLLKEIKRDL